MDDRVSFERLVRDHYPPARQFAYRITGNSVDAEDLVQETFLRAFRFFAKYDSAYPFQSWLYRIMLNANVDLLRRRGRIKTTHLDEAIDQFQGANDFASSSPDDHLMRSTMDESLQKSLLTLSSQFRTAVLLADVEGMSYEEIARVMESSVGTVRSRVHRGRKQLRKLLTKGRVGSRGEFRFEL